MLLSQGRRFCADDYASLGLQAHLRLPITTFAILLSVRETVIVLCDPDASRVIGA